MRGNVQNIDTWYVSSQKLWFVKAFVHKQKWSAEFVLTCGTLRGGSAHRTVPSFPAGTPMWPFSRIMNKFMKQGATVRLISGGGQGLFYFNTNNGFKSCGKKLIYCNKYFFPF